MELANAFNTMSECLEEHITRLRESSLARERLYGEYECSLLLQYHMLEKIIEEWDHPLFEIRLLKIASGIPSKGLFLDLHALDNHQVRLFLAEANEPGFLGIYDLLSHGAFLPEQGTSLLKEYPSIMATIGSTISYTVHQMPQPLVWHMQNLSFVSDSNHAHLQSGDQVLFYNEGFGKQFLIKRIFKNGWLRFYGILVLKVWIRFLLFFRGNLVFWLISSMLTKIWWFYV